MWEHAEYWAILSTDSRAGQRQQTVQSSCTESSQPAWQRDTHRYIESTQCREILQERDTHRCIESTQCREILQERETIAGCTESTHSAERYCTPERHHSTARRTESTHSRERE